MSCCADWMEPDEFLLCAEKNAVSPLEHALVVRLSAALSYITSLEEELNGYDTGGEGKISHQEVA